ncbi:MAG: ADP-ribosylation factor-like protein, partial [Promethearchaeota archaeon]
DLGGQRTLREGYLKKPQIYLYETDLLFYFIDIQDRSRIEESILYFKEILKKMYEELNEIPPILFILSKGDEDIINTKEIKENIKIIKSKLINECQWERPIEFHITSIFSIFTILRAFSSGITKLSPYRELIQQELKKLSIKSGTSISLLLNNEGLVLADYYSHDSKKILSIINEKNENMLDQELKDILEFTAPQFAIIWKIFSKFKNLKKNEALFNIANFYVLIKELSINNTRLFLLFLLDDEKKINFIDKNLPEFLEKSRDILSTYLT